jgi:beta-glucosidase
MGKEGPLTEIGWEVYPRGPYEIVQRVSNEYKLPIEITENGCSYGDYPDANGRVADDRRIHYYREHLRELARATRDGADVRGYRAWLWRRIWHCAGRTLGSGLTACGRCSTRCAGW